MSPNQRAGDFFGDELTGQIAALPRHPYYTIYTVTWIVNSGVRMRVVKYTRIVADRIELCQAL